MIFYRLYTLQGSPFAQSALGFTAFYSEFMIMVNLSVLTEPTGNAFFVGYDVCTSILQFALFPSEACGARSHPNNYTCLLLKLIRVLQAIIPLLFLPSWLLSNRK